MRVPLILTNSNDPTAALVEDVLRARGAAYLRMNTEDFGSAFRIDVRVGRGATETVLEGPWGRLTADRIGAVWNRRPEPPRPPDSLVGESPRQFAAEELKAALDGALATLACRWVSAPEAIRKAGLKPFQLGLAAGLGFAVPQTLISSDPSRIREFAESVTRRGGKLIAKLVSKGPPRAPTIQEQYVVFTQVLGAEDLASDEALSACPAIFQEYVEKAYELRVTVVGRQVFACAIHSQATEKTRVDWRRYDLPNTPHEACTLAPDLERRCLELTRRLGLEFAAIDLVVRPDGEAVFLELNPNGQWGWIQKLAGLPIAESIADLLTEDVS